ncbi:MAG: PEP-CTERM system TPR-repeat protein PrsT, partial [Pseudomonadota bacterium]|nr:PEP-CTERM system TPR-repeat protein PrsT [Pseudomonadota bacterium]
PGRVRLFAILLALLRQTASSASQADKFVDEARAYLEQGKLNASVIQLKNALQKDPANLQARFLLGQVYLRIGDGASAEKEIRRARELGLERGQWLVPLTRALLLQGQQKRAIDEIALEPDDPADIKASVMALQGLGLASLGQIEGGEARLDEALRLAPDNVDALVGKARLDIRRGDLDAAAALVDKALAQEPAGIDGWLVKGEIQRLRQDYPAALEAFARVLELSPGNITALLGRAETQISQGEFDQALETIATVTAAQPSLPAAHYLRGRIFFQRQDFPAALEDLQQVLRYVPNHLPSQLMLGAINYAQGNLAQAQEYLSRFVAAQPQHLPARKLLAATHMKLRNPRKAVDLLAAALPQAPGDAQLLALLGSAYLQDRDYAKGSEYLQKAAEIAPDVSAIRAQLALSHLATGETGQAVTELEQAVDLGQGLVQADILLILTHLQNRDFDEAVKAANALVEKLPDNPMPYNLLGVAYMSQDQHQQARDAFTKALEIQPDFTTAELNLAQLDLKVGDKGAAAGRYQQILERDAANLNAMLGLAALAEQAGRRDEALQRLETAWEKHPDAAQVGLLLVQRYLTDGQPLKAVNVARTLQSAHPNQPLVIRALGFALLAADNTADALANFRRLTELLPNAAEPWHMVAAAQVRAQDYAAAAQAVDRALAVQPDYLPAQVLKAELLLRDQRPEPALAVARAIQEQQPAAAIGHKLEGDVHLQQGDAAKAIAAYQAAHDKSPSGQSVILLSNAYRLANDNANALNVLSEWLQAHPDDDDVRGRLALYLQVLDRRGEAIAEYETLLKRHPDNVIILNNLAWLYHQTGDARGVKYAEKAVEIAPDRPEVTDTLGWILVQSDQTRRGLVLLQQAVVQAPHHPEIRFHLAVAYDKAGRPEEARRELERVLGSNQPFDGVEQARALLDKLKKAQ